MSLIVHQLQYVATNWCTVKSQLQVAPVYKPHHQISGQYTGKILVAIDKRHRYITDVIRSVSGTSRIVICQTLLL